MADGTTAHPVDATSIETAHPSSSVADRLTADLSTMDISARLPNFPIPRELRDQIYGYLLDGDYTRIQRKLDQVPEDHNKTGPRAYHFHTNILAVNREIHAEAEELLYKSNIFVVVSYEWPSLDKEWGNHFWVPIVSNKFVNRMSLHSLRIHVDPGLAALRDPARRANARLSVESYIILAGDLLGFGVSMQVTNETFKAPAILISDTSATNPTLRFMGGDVKRAEPTRMRCQLRDTKYRLMDSKLQDCLLAPLASITRLAQKVSFTGAVCNPKQVERLKKVMGPTLICGNALFGSARVEGERAKEVADATLEHDELDFLIHMYRMLMNRLSVRMRTMTGDNRALFMTVSPFAEMIMEMDTFMVELLQIAACAELKLGRIDAFMQTCDQMQDVLSVAPGADGGPSSLLTPPLLDRHFSILLYQHLYGPHRDYNPIPRGGTFAQLTGILNAVPSNHDRKLCLGPHLAYDHAILARYPDRDAVLTAEHLPLEQCAAFVFPCMPTSYHKMTEDEMEQRHYDGLQDLGFLRSLTIDVQNRIHDAQKIYMLEETDFSQL